MAHIKPHRLNHQTVFKVILGIDFLICGCAIYLLFRSKSLNIYQWCVTLGLSDYIDSLRNSVKDWNIPDIVRYSFPDGLYCAAYILIMDAIWQNDSRAVKFIIISLIPLITITSEIMQYFGLVKGTFDKYDLLCYSLPPIIYILGVHLSSKNNNKRICYE